MEGWRKIDANVEKGFVGRKMHTDSTNIGETIRISCRHRTIRCRNKIEV